MRSAKYNAIFQTQCESVCRLPNATQSTGTNETSCPFISLSKCKNKSVKQERKHRWKKC